MNAQELHAAADKIEAAGNLRMAWAMQAAAGGRDTERQLHTAVAQQLHDRASQTRSWATTRGYHEQRGEAYPAENEARITEAVREFLTMAGRTVDNA